PARTDAHPAPASVPARQALPAALRPPPGPTRTPPDLPGRLRPDPAPSSSSPTSLARPGHHPSARPDEPCLSAPHPLPARLTDPTLRAPTPPLPPPPPRPPPFSPIPRQADTNQFAPRQRQAPSSPNPLLRHTDSPSRRQATPVPTRRPSS